MTDTFLGWDFDDILEASHVRDALEQQMFCVEQASKFGCAPKRRCCAAPSAFAPPALTSPAPRQPPRQQPHDADFVPTPAKQRNFQLPPATASAAAAAAALKRKRIPACDACNQKKIKCDGFVNCSNCAKASIKCTFDRSAREAKLALASVSSKRKRGDSTLSVATSDSSLAAVAGISQLAAENTSLNPIDPNLQNLLIDAYFDFVDPWIPVVNKPSFLANPHGQHSLLNAICALGALFCSSPSIIDLGKLEGGPFLTDGEARQKACEYFYLQSNSSIEETAGASAQLSVVSALLLLHYLCSGLGRAPASWLHMEAAINELSALRNSKSLDDIDNSGKPIESSSATWSEKEHWRRLWWFCYISERSSAVTLDRKFLMADSDCRVYFPGPYTDWIEGLASSEASSEISERKTKQTVAFSSSIAFARIDVSGSPLDHFILLSQIFGRILAFSKFHKPSQTATNQMTSTADMQLNILETSLKSWHAFLPEYYRDSLLLVALPVQTRLFATCTLLQYNLCTILLHKPTLLACLRSTPAQLHGTTIPAMASFIACHAAARGVSELVASTDEAGLLERLEPTAGCAAIFHAALVRLISGQVFLSAAAAATAAEPARADAAAEIDAASRLARALEALAQRWGCAAKMWTSLVGVIAVARAEVTAHDAVLSPASGQDPQSTVLGIPCSPAPGAFSGPSAWRPAVGLGVNMTASSPLQEITTFDRPVNVPGSNAAHGSIADGVREEVGGILQLEGRAAYNFGLLGGSAFGANELFPNASDFHLWPGIADQMALLGDGTDFGPFGRDAQS
ncbi:hypothetical protein HDU83_005686 [Entophlyctis luteolus]|nr:hypothetical protein HDU83_005686 [Entophlyctis luteolus]